MKKSLFAGGQTPPITKDVKLSEAAGMSARFPWVLPAATITRDGKVMRLVDGGYFDNSGIESALDLIESLVAISQRVHSIPADASGPQVSLDFDIRVITISGTVEDGPPPRQGLDDVLSPVRALLSSRDARGNLTATKLQTGHYIYGSGEHTFDSRPAATLDEQDMAMALGFQLSKNSIELIGAQVGDADQDGKIWGTAAVQTAERQDPNITRKQHRVMDNMQANSYTPCAIKYWLNGQEIPQSGYPCEKSPVQ